MKLCSYLESTLGKMRQMRQLKRISPNCKHMLNKINKRSRKPMEFKQKNKQCIYCGKHHEMKQGKYPPYGQTCSKCNKLNHFENKDTASTKHGPTVKKKVNIVDFGDSSDLDHYYQSNSVVSSDEVGTVNFLNCKTAHATMLIQGQKVQFQPDAGASCNIIPCVTYLFCVQLTTGFVCTMAQPSSLS